MTRNPLPTCSFISDHDIETGIQIMLDKARAQRTLQSGTPTKSSVMRYILRKALAAELGNDFGKKEASHA